MKRLKILKWMGIVTAAGITVLLMLNAYFVWSTGIELERKTTGSCSGRRSGAARGPCPRADPPEKNADLVLRRAADDFDAIEKELLAHYPGEGLHDRESVDGRTRQAGEVVYFPSRADAAPRTGGDIVRIPISSLMSACRPRRFSSHISSVRNTIAC